MGTLAGQLSHCLLAMQIGKIIGGIYQDLNRAGKILCIVLNYMFA